MTWKTIARWEVRRRAVLCGRAFDEDGKPFTDADRLTLCASDEATLPSTKRKRRQRSPTPEAQTLRKRLYACHMPRKDGNFFFLDAPAGNYRLNLVDLAGKLVQTQEVLLPPYDSKVKVPIVTIDFEIAKTRPGDDLSSV